MFNDLNDLKLMIIILHLCTCIVKPKEGDSHPVGALPIGTTICQVNGVLKLYLLEPLFVR
jgi:hypothetical protein